MAGVRRFVLLAGLLCGCGTGSTATARAPSRAALAREGAPLEFAGQQGTAPSGQVVALGLRGEVPSPRVKVAYADGAGWLSAGIFGAGDGRTLSVQPISHRLAPGTYRATIELEGAAAPLRRLEVALVVRGDTGSSCPPGSTLRYAGGGDGGREPADFGRTFFTTYCTGCHGAAVVGAARSGAPPEANWDAPATIRAQRHWIDAVAGRGPGASHEDMPPDWVPVRPTRGERELLAQWIACGAP